MKRRKHRRSRKNAWFGSKAGHSRAARKGHARRKRHSRRTRRNAGSMSFHTATRAATAGFNTNVLARGGAVVYGNVSTTAIAEYLMKMVPQLGSHKALEVLSILGVAIANGIATQKFAPRVVAKHANDIFIGGLLAGTTRALKFLMPGTFATCGLRDDMDGLGDDGMEGWGPLNGMGDWTISPHQIRNAINTSGGMGSYAHLDQPIIGTSGMGDQANIGQTGQQHLTRLVTLDGFANAEVENEIAGMM